MRELRRQRDHIELIASENFVSEAVMEVLDMTGFASLMTIA